MATTAPDGYAAGKPKVEKDPRIEQRAIVDGKPVPTSTRIETGTTTTPTVAAPTPIYSGESSGRDSEFAEFMAFLQAQEAERNRQIAARQAELDKQRAEQKAAMEKQKAETLAAWEQGAEEYRNNQAALRDSQNELINSNYSTSSERLGSARDTAHRDGYVSYMKGLKAMPQTAALNGNGGYAQSLMAKHQLGYEDNRQSTEREYLENLKDLQAQRDAALQENANTYNTNISNFDLDYANRVANLNQNYAAGMYNIDNDYINNVLATEQMYSGGLDLGDYDFSSMFNTSSSAKNAATGNSFTGQYNVNGRTMTRDELMAYFAANGMNAQQAAEYMQKNNIPY